MGTGNQPVLPALGPQAQVAGGPGCFWATGGAEALYPPEKGEHKKIALRETTARNTKR
jgi:hypothetical protein